MAMESRKDSFLGMRILAKIRKEITRRSLVAFWPIDCILELTFPRANVLNINILVIWLFELRTMELFMRNECDMEYGLLIR